MDPDAFLGTWRLRSWRAESDDGEVIHPLGERVQGLIHYHAGGRMSVLIAAPDRPRFATDDLLAGSAAEKAAAFESFIAYAGSFEVGDGFVTHRLEVCSFPNWVGTEQKRYAALTGDTLTLSTDPIPQRGKPRRAVLVWERVAAS